MNDENWPVHKERFCSLLFLAMFMFLWITVNPYIDLVQREAAGATAGSVSNLLNQISILLLTCLMLTLAASSRMRHMIVQPRILISAIFLWYLLVSALSPHPVDAVKRTILAAMTCANAGIFLLLPRSDKHFARLLLIGSLVMLAFAYFGVIFLTTRSIHSANEIAEPMLAGDWRGQYTHKNVAAAVMLVATFFALFIYESGYRLGAIVVGALALFFLMHTGGKSAAAMLPAILMIAWAFELWKWARIPIGIGGIALFNLFTLGASLSDSISKLIALVGVDPTFTNRTDIWKVAINGFAQSPILGYGFQGFWQSDELVFSGSRLETWAVNAFNGHNAYLDTLLTTGVPGFVLTMGWILVLPLIYISKADHSTNNPGLTRLFLRIWLYGIYAGCLESVFFQSGSPVWFAMMFSIFGLRMQAYARLCDREVPQPVRPSAAHV